MVNYSRIEKIRVSNKGQSLVEVAVFGAFLLIVLGFLLNSGMEYNYQQEVKMDAFRRAMQMASASPVPKAQVVQEDKDVHFPDPSDMFALGTRGSIKSSSSVFWSNNSTQLDYATPETSPTKRFVFNPRHPLVSIQNRTYTTAALEPEYASNVIPGHNSILNGVPHTFVINDLSQTKVFQEERDFGSKEVMVLMNGTTVDCEAQYCEKDILGQVKFNSPRGGFEYYPVYNVTDGDVGEQPNIIAFLNDQAGQINSTLEARQVENKTLDKNSYLTLTEDAGSYTSSEILNNHETIKHVIITATGEDGPTFVFRDAEPSKTWTTPK
jgi:hypothetical protein